ncbi:MAG: amino acid ABC transporter ATP-binding protein [Alphaproteobacteria bacterium]
MNMRLEAISKSFQGQVVLHPLSGEILPGEVLVLIGPSGSGKTTLLRCLNGIETPDAGCIYLDGVAVRPSQWPAYRQRIGILFQHFQLFPHLSILENITYAPIRVKKIAPEAAKAAAHHLLENVGLGSKDAAFPHQLSGGEKQRVAIARALAMEPEVLLFDEPTSALDPERVGEVLQVIRGLVHTGITMVISTHEMAFAQQIANHVWFLDKGELVEKREASAFFKSPNSPRAQQFLSRVYAR